MTLARQEWGIFSFLWSFLSMEGMEHLSLTKDGLIIDLMSPYTLDQLRQHEVSYQVPLTNLPLEGTKRQLWSR
jgi:hypothetical protein